MNIVVQMYFFSIICIWSRHRNAISQRKISWLTGDFPPTPWSAACLHPPLCFLPSCFPCPHCAMALLELAASHCPILGCSCQGHPLPTTLTMLQPQGDNPGLGWSVTKLLIPGWQHGHGVCGNGLCTGKERAGSTSTREIAQGLLFSRDVSREWAKVCRWAFELQKRQNKMGTSL